MTKERAGLGLRRGIRRPRPDTLTYRQAAKILGVHRHTVRRWLGNGTLPSLEPEDVGGLARRRPAGTR